MQFTALAVDLVTLTLLILWFGLRILVRRSWLLAWLRGTCGLALMAANRPAGQTTERRSQAGFAQLGGMMVAASGIIPFNKILI